MDVKNVAQQPPGLNLQTLRRLKFWVWFQELTRPTELQVTLIWAGDGERLPVVSHDRQLIGSIAKTDVILALAGSTARPATTMGSAASQ